MNAISCRSKATRSRSSSYRRSRATRSRWRLRSRKLLLDETPATPTPLSTRSTRLSLDELLRAATTPSMRRLRGAKRQACRGSTSRPGPGRLPDAAGAAIAAACLEDVGTLGYDTISAARPGRRQAHHARRDADFAAGRARQCARLRRDRGAWQSERRSAKPGRRTAFDAHLHRCRQGGRAAVPMVELARQDA